MFQKIYHLFWLWYHTDEILVGEICNKDFLGICNYFQVIKENILHYRTWTSYKANGKRWISCNVNFTMGRDGSLVMQVFGRPFIKRFALCCWSVVCLSVCDVVVLCQTVGWIMMKLGTEVGLGPGSNDIVLDGDPAPPKRVTARQFSAHVRGGQMALWNKIPLRMEQDVRR